MIQVAIRATFSASPCSARMAANPASTSRMSGGICTSLRKRNKDVQSNGCQENDLKLQNNKSKHCSKARLPSDERWGGSHPLPSGHAVQPKLSRGRDLSDYGLPSQQLDGVVSQVLSTRGGRIDRSAGWTASGETERRADRSPKAQVGNVSAT